MWEHPPDVLLLHPQLYPGLLPLAVLAQTHDREALLQQVADVIQQILGPTERANTMTATDVMAQLHLSNEVIYRILRRDAMQESTVYQSILAEGEERGRNQERINTQREITTNLLQAGLAPDLIASTTELSIAEIQQLQQHLNRTGE